MGGCGHRYPTRVVGFGLRGYLDQSPSFLTFCRSFPTLQPILNVIHISEIMSAQEVTSQATSIAPCAIYTKFFLGQEGSLFDNAFLTLQPGVTWRRVYAAWQILLLSGRPATRFDQHLNPQTKILLPLTRKFHDISGLFESTDWRQAFLEPKAPTGCARVQPLLRFEGNGFYFLF